jgi:hypothetical protein
MTLRRTPSMMLALTVSRKDLAQDVVDLLLAHDLADERAQGFDCDGAKLLVLHNGVSRVPAIRAIFGTQAGPLDDLNEHSVGQTIGVSDRESGYSANRCLVAHHPVGLHALIAAADIVGLSAAGFVGNHNPRDGRFGRELHMRFSLRLRNLAQVLNRCS